MFRETWNPSPMYTVAFPPGRISTDVDVVRSVKDAWVLFIKMGWTIWSIIDSFLINIYLPSSRQSVIKHPAFIRKTIVSLVSAKRSIPNPFLEFLESLVSSESLELLWRRVPQGCHPYPERLPAAATQSSHNLSSDSQQRTMLKFSA